MAGKINKNVNMQKEQWEKEYRENRNWPSSYRTEPSKALVEFFEDGYKVSGSALDIGSGFGRNSIYLANQRLEVVGIEMIPYAIEVARERASEKGVLDKIRFEEQSVSEKIPFPGGYFGLIIDMMTMHVLTSPERELYAKEVVRILKPGGYFVFHTISADSPEAIRLFKESPAKEGNSYIIRQNGMVEHAFTKQELLDLFSPLKFVKFKGVVDETKFQGKVYQREYYSGVMTK